jgi:hypothetical protein
VKIGRNNPCPCGSELKFKKFCANKVVSLNSELAQVITHVSRTSISLFSPNFELISSFEWHGHRHRFVFNRIYYRPLNDTFHDFLFYVIMQTYGSKWCGRQSGMSIEGKHVVSQWFEAADRFRSEYRDKIETESTPHGLVFSAEMDGPQQALLSFGWDLYCLQSKNKLPEDVLKKLRKNDTFQSFRYEIAVAAIMMRAGFDIEWYDTSGNEGKRSEFVAVHRNTGLKVTVEAKSIHREGVLHMKGLPDPTAIKAKQIARRLKDAEKKKEEGIPHLVFIDINRPPSDSDLKRDIEYIKTLVNAMPPLSDERPAKHEALFLTNFSPYYGGVGQPLPKHQHYSVFPSFCADKRSLGDYQEIINSLDHYSFIPDEI